MLHPSPSSFANLVTFIIWNRLLYVKLPTFSSFSDKMSSFIHEIDQPFNSFVYKFTGRMTMRCMFQNKIYIRTFCELFNDLLYLKIGRIIFLRWVVSVSYYFTSSCMAVPLCLPPSYVGFLQIKKLLKAYVPGVEISSIFFRNRLSHLMLNRAFRFFLRRL